MHHGGSSAHKQADFMLLRAQADAQLAQSLAVESSAKQDAAHTSEQIRALMDQSSAPQ